MAHSDGPKFRFTRLILGIVLVSVVVTRIFLVVLEDQTPRTNKWIRNRLFEAVENLPTIAATKGDVALYLGTSDIESAINPEFIDKEIAKSGVDVISYNLAIRNMSLSIPAYLSRISEEFSSKNRRLKFAAIKFTAARATKQTRASAWGRSTEELDCPSYSLSMLARLIPEDPIQALRLAIYKTAFSCRTPYAEFGYIRPFLVGVDQDPSYDPVALAAFADLHTQIWYGPTIYNEPAWDLRSRGFFNWGLPESAAIIRPAVAKMLTASIENVHTILNVRQFDAAELNFDPELVANFIQSVHKIQAIADHTYIFYFPDKPSFKHSQAAQQRLKETLVEIAAATGGKMFDYSDRGIFENADYMDVLHLNERGSAKLMRALASDIAKDLKGKE